MRVGHLILAIDWQVSRKGYNPCPGLRVLVLYHLCAQLVDSIKLPEQLRNKCLANRRGLWEKSVGCITVCAQQARGLEVSCA